MAYANIMMGSKEEDEKLNNIYINHKEINL